jgi:hypothetical protein
VDPRAGLDGCGKSRSNRDLIPGRNDAMFPDILKEGVAFISKVLEVLAGVHFCETPIDHVVWGHIIIINIATWNFSTPSRNNPLWTLQIVQRVRSKLATVNG